MQDKINGNHVTMIIPEVQIGVTGIKTIKESQICKKCNSELSIDEFRIKTRFNNKGEKVSYKSGVCKKCENERKKLYRANLPEEKRKELNDRKKLADQKRRENMTEDQKQELKNKQKQYKENLPDWKRDEQKMLQNIRVTENKRKWLKHKETEGCFHCKGENLGKSVALFGEAYDSHHVHENKKTDSKGKTVELSAMVSGGYTWQNISEELDKCVTLCKFCHSQWHAKNIYINFQGWKNYNSNLPLKI